MSGRPATENGVAGMSARVTPGRPLTRHPTAPDGGWGWWVMLSSFVLQWLAGGVTFTFGVLYVDLLEEFQEDDAVTAFIGSMQSFITFLAGLFVDVLIKKIGWRWVTILGSCVSCSGYLFSALATNVYVLCLTYGIVMGFGMGLMYVTSLIVIQAYFDRLRGTATGVAVAGLGVGIMTFPFILRYSLDNMGLQLTLCLIGGISLIGIPCGVIYKPLDPVDQGNPYMDGIETQEPGLYSMKELDLSNGNAHGEHTESSLLVQKDENENQKLSWFTRHFGNLSCRCSQTSIWRNPIFLQLCTAQFTFMIGYEISFTFVPDRGMSLGLSSMQASVLVSIIGLSNVSCRFLFGWMVDRYKPLRFYCAMAAIFLNSVAGLCMPLFDTEGLMALYSTLFGISVGFWSAAIIVCVSDLVGEADIGKAVGYSLAVGSVAFLIAPPLAGYIIEKTDDYSLPFMVAGGVGVIGAVSFCLIPLSQKYLTRAQPEYEPLVDN